MKPAALFYDIDGTLYSEIENVVPESAFEALKKAKENGHYLFINTGRTYCSMPSPIKRFPFDGYICGCGTYAEYKDEVLYSSTLSIERSQAIIKKMEECKIDGIFEGIEDDYFPIRVSRFDKLENTRRYFRNMGIGIEMFAGKDQFAYDKLFVYTDEQSDVKGFLEFLEQEEMEAIDRQYGTYEIMPIGHSKATGCEIIRKHLHLDLDQIYVFGDSSNDLPMMEYTSHAIVMGHHDPILDPCAQIVTKTVEEDGIQYAMKELGLI